MSKKTRLVLVLAAACAALLLIPAIGFASAAGAAHGGKPVAVPQSQGSPAGRKIPPTSPGSLGYTALITTGIDAGQHITGGIELTFDVPGNNRFPFHGTLYMPIPSHEQFALQGLFVLHKNGSSFVVDANYTIFNADGTVRITGKGMSIATANTGFLQYAGTLALYDGNSFHNHQIGTGIWSFLFVQSHTTLGLAFKAAVDHGKDFGKTYYGALTLDASTLAGNTILADGTLIVTTASINSKGVITLVLTFPDGGVITAMGKTSSIGAKGMFTGPASGDSGAWSAYFFKLKR